MAYLAPSVSHLAERTDTLKLKRISTVCSYCEFSTENQIICKEGNLFKPKPGEPGPKFG